MQSDGEVEQIAAERTKPRKRPLLVGSGKLAVSGDIGRQNGREFAGLRHGRTRWVSQSSTPTRSGVAEYKSKPTASVGDVAPLWYSASHSEADEYVCD